MFSVGHAFGGRAQRERGLATGRDLQRRRCGGRRARVRERARERLPATPHALADSIRPPRSCRSPVQGNRIIRLCEQRERLGYGQPAHESPPLDRFQAVRRAAAQGWARSQLLRWICGFYLKTLPFTLAVTVLVLVWVSEVWLLILLGVSALIGLQSVISLSVRIWREEHRERR